MTESPTPSSAEPGPRGARTGVRAYGAALVLGLVAACGGSGPEDPRALLRAAERPAIVFVVVDTLRADRLGCYGYELDTSPVLDELAERSYVFEAASTQCNATFPSITSIMTGLFPRTHRNYLPVPIEGMAELGADHASLTELLRDAGYHTLASASHTAWREERVESAIFRGWERFSTIPEHLNGRDRSLHDKAEYTNERMFELLDEYEREGSGKPLFVWMHYFDPHQGYHPPEGYRTRFLEAHLRAIGEEALLEEHPELSILESFSRSDFPQLLETLEKDLVADGFQVRRTRTITAAVHRAMYDAEIAYTDDHLGRLLERIGRIEGVGDPLVVLMADHGENMGDPDPEWLPPYQFNHDGMFDGVVRVPLVLHLPGQTRGARVAGITQNVDVYPTLAELLELETAAVDGRSLVPQLLDPDASVHDQVFSESKDHVQKVVRTDVLKMLHRGEGLGPLVFRWREDLEEREDVAGMLPESVLLDLEGRVQAFKPKDHLRVRFTPAAEPYAATLLLLPDKPIVESAESEFGELVESADGVSWSVRVEDAPVDLSLFLDEAGLSFEVELSFDGEESDPGRVFIGRVPVEETSATPIYTAADRPSAPEAGLALSGRDGGERTIELELREGQRAELEIRNRGARTLEEIARFTEARGFTPLEVNATRLGPVGILSSRAEGPGHFLARIRFPESDRDRHVLLRIDGRWPDPASISLDGRAVGSERLGFVLPHRSDGRVTAALIAGSEDQAVPPGSVVFWMQDGGGFVDIDVSTLSEERVRELRNLGYVR